MKISGVNLCKPGGLLYSAKKTNVSVPISSSCRQITDLSNITCIAPIAFKGRISEHRSYGANIYEEINPATGLKEKKVSFKVATFSNADKVIAHVYKKNSEGKPVHVRDYPLEKTDAKKGIFEIKGISANQVKEGYRYNFSVYKNGEEQRFKDPYSKRQKEFFEYSTLYDHNNFKWKNDDNWKINPKRISRLADDKNNLSNIRKSRIYELHIPTFTQQGTYLEAINKMDKLVEDGFNTIEIMPVENTYSFNWGYDGVDKFAVSEYSGTPDDLKKFVDTAHKKGLNVVLDVVYNHTGTDGNDLRKAGPFLREKGNEFGDAFNYYGEQSETTREFVTNAALSWLDNYHFDGLRFDMTSRMDSDFVLAEIVSEINQHFPDVFLIAEDGRDDDMRITSPLHEVLDEKGKSEDEHVVLMKEFEKTYVKNDDRSVLTGLGFDSRWAFPYHHSLHTKLGGCNEGIGDIEHFISTCHKSQNFVNYISSHDEQGNESGTRNVVKYMVNKLNLFGDYDINSDDSYYKKGNVILTEKSKDGKLSDMDRAAQYALEKKKDLWGKDGTIKIVYCQKIQDITEQLAQAYQLGNLEQYNYPPKASYIKKQAIDKRFFKEVLEPMGLKKETGITYEKIKEAFNEASAKVRMGALLTYAKPGIKMVFQGDENLSISSFRFAREFSPGSREKDDKIIEIEKGYKPGIYALMKSKPDSYKYPDEKKVIMDKFEQLIKDASILNDKNSSLTTGEISEIDELADRKNNIAGIHCIDSKNGNEIYTVANFSEKKYSYDTNNPYSIRIPEGKWIEVMNSDDEKYGGSGLLNPVSMYNPFESYPKKEGNGNECLLNLAPFTTIVLKRIG